MPKKLYQKRYKRDKRKKSFLNYPSKKNSKYHERGSLFQGGYKGKTVHDNSHFSYLPFYVLVKNVFELYPGGITEASKNFNKAWQWATDYEFSSFGSTIKNLTHPTVNDPEETISKFLKDESVFKKESQELLLFHMNTRGREGGRGEKFKSIMLENW